MATTSKRNSYKSGDWLATCDVCDFVHYASELKHRWDGLRVCEKDWEPRHPLDFIRGITENIAPPWTRPNMDELETPTDVEFGFVGPLVISDESVIVDATGGNITMQMPAANAVPAPGQGIVIQRVDATSNTVTVTPSGADTINNAASFLLPPMKKFIATSDDVSRWTIQ